MAQPPRAVYIHVPFCLSLCPYCDFVVYAGAAARGARSRIAAYVEALLAEIELRGLAVAATHGAERPALDSVYLGGGTPSLLDPDDLSAILRQVRDSYGVAPDAEVTLEANPGPGERGDLGAARRAGVTRVSFGAQSFVPSELVRLGRRHGPGDVAEAVNVARDAGIASISIDLLYDIPDQTVDSWAQSLDVALALDPDHLSLYALTLDDPAAEGLTGATGDHLATPVGARRWRARARTGQDDDRAAAMYHVATARLAAAGWRGYEISNWARPGHESRHNLAYWRRVPCDAVGPGAHAFDGHVRRWNGARLDTYLEALAARRLPPGGAERVDAATAAAESIILALRTDEGAPVGAFSSARASATLDWSVGLGLATVVEDRVRLTTDGRLLSNEVFARLL